MWDCNLNITWLQATSGHWGPTFSLLTCSLLASRCVWLSPELFLQSETVYSPAPHFQPETAQKSACASRTRKVSGAEVQDVPLKREKNTHTEKEKATQVDGLLYSRLSTFITTRLVYFQNKHGISDDIQLSSGFSQSVFGTLHGFSGCIRGSLAYYQIPRRRYSQNRQRGRSGMFACCFFPLSTNWLTN